MSDGETKEVLTIYTYEGKVYYETDDRGHGPFPTLRAALQDISVEIDLAEGRIP